MARFIDEIPRDKRSPPNQLHFDNLFTSFDLLNHLCFVGYEGTGTIQENYIGKTCPLTPLPQYRAVRRRKEDL